MCGQVSQPACSGVVAEVTAALCQLARTVIRFPYTEEEQAQTKIGFHRVAGFPNILGCIDGTHVCIRRPPTEHQEQYVNRHQRFSINVMAVCDAGLRFSNVFADYPGSNGDAFIFAQSSLARRFENGTIVDGWLLGTYWQGVLQLFIFSSYTTDNNLLYLSFVIR
jgi:nuclease HARBI1